MIFNFIFSTATDNWGKAIESGTLCIQSRLRDSKRLSCATVDCDNIQEQTVNKDSIPASGERENVFQFTFPALKTRVQSKKGAVRMGKKGLQII